MSVIDADITVGALPVPDRTRTSNSLILLLVSSGQSSLINRFRLYVLTKVVQRLLELDPRALARQDEHFGTIGHVLVQE